MLALLLIVFTVVETPFGPVLDAGSLLILLNVGAMYPPSLYEAVAGLLAAAYYASLAPVIDGLSYFDGATGFAFYGATWTLLPSRM